MTGRSNYPFRERVPRWLGIPVMMLMFFPPSFSGGTYLGNMSEMQGGLGIYSESVQMGNQLVFVGMCLFLPFMIPYLKTRRPKQVFLWGFAGLFMLNLICAVTTNELLLFAACLLIGFARIMLMLNCTFTVAPYLTGFNSLEMLTVEVDPMGDIGRMQDKTRTTLMPVLYTFILAIINLCNVIMTWIAYLYDWQHAYYLEMGILLAGMLIVLLTMTDEPQCEPFLMDWHRLPGMLMMGTFLVCLCYVMNYGKTLDWWESDRIVIATALGLIAIGVFTLLQIYGKGERYLPLGIFRYRNVWMASLLFILFIVMNASNVLNTSFSHIASPANDMQIGAQSRWAMLGCLLGVVLALVMVVRKVGFRIIFLISFLLMAASNLMMYFIFQSEIQLHQLALPIVLMNAGLLILYALVAAFGMKRLPNHLIAVFVFIMILTRNAIAPPIGSALYSNWLYQRQQYHIAVLSENMDATNTANPKQLMAKGRAITVQSTLSAMKDVTGKTLWAFCAVGMLILVVPHRAKDSSCSSE